MDLFSQFGLPQLAAFSVLCQRGLEELYSMRNTRALLAKGGHEEGRDYYPVVAVAHLAWLASVATLTPSFAPISIPLAALYLALQGARYWIISTLGPYWTHRIITLDNAPIVRDGPYAHVAHPNYIVTVAETFLLPAMFGSYALAFIMTAIWCAVLYYKVMLEDRAIERRKSASQSSSAAK